MAEDQSIKSQQPDGSSLTMWQSRIMMLTIFFGISALWIAIFIGLSTRDLLNIYKDESWKLPSAAILATLSGYLQEFWWVWSVTLFVGFYFWVRRSDKRLLWLNGLVCIIVLFAISIALAIRIAQIEKINRPVLLKEHP